MLLKHDLFIMEGKTFKYIRVRSTLLDQVEFSLITKDGSQPVFVFPAKNISQRLDCSFASPWNIIVTQLSFLSF